MSGSRYAILGDVHGNWEALSAVLDDARASGVDAFMSVGDIVGYNADPCRCLDRIRELDCMVVRGNHDHYCSYSESLNDFHPLAANVIAWTRQQLSSDHVAYLRSLELYRIVDGFTLVHSTLDMPDRWGYVFDALEAQAHFNYQSTALCFYGHTHLPVVFEKQGRVVRREFSQVRLERGRKYFINVGSVGQPRDGDPRAAYVMYDTATREVTLRRIFYDVTATQEKIRAAGLPDRCAERLAKGA